MRQRPPVKPSGVSGLIGLFVGQQPLPSRPRSDLYGGPTIRGKRQERFLAPSTEPDGQVALSISQRGELVELRWGVQLHKFESAVSSVGQDCGYASSELWTLMGSRHLEQATGARPQLPRNRRSKSVRTV